MYITWHSYFQRLVNTYGQDNPVNICSLSGRAIGKTYLEVINQPTGDSDLMAVISYLLLSPGDNCVIGIACSLQDREGRYRGGSIGWLIGDVSPSDTEDRLRAWASQYGADNTVSITEPDGSPHSLVILGKKIILPTIERPIDNCSLHMGKVVSFPSRRAHLN